MRARVPGGAADAGGRGAAAARRHGCCRSRPRRSRPRAAPHGGNWACCGSASASRPFRSCCRTSCCGSVPRCQGSSSGCATWPRTAQVAALVRGDLDVGFVRLPVIDPRIDTRPILRERLVALLGTRQPLELTRRAAIGLAPAVHHDRPYHLRRLLRSRDRRLPRRRLHAEHRAGDQRALHDDDARARWNGRRARSQLRDDSPSAGRSSQSAQGSGCRVGYRHRVESRSTRGAARARVRGDDAPCPSRSCVVELSAAG